MDDARLADFEIELAAHRVMLAALVAHLLPSAAERNELFHHIETNAAAISDHAVAAAVTSRVAAILGVLG